jgi:hypothetical protein
LADANYVNGWNGFGISSTANFDVAPFGEFGFLMRHDGQFVAFTNGAVASVGALTFNPYSSILQVNAEFDEVAGNVTVTYNAFALADFAFLGSQNMGTFDVGFADGDRFIDFRQVADSVTAPSGISTYYENILIETIPEPATMGLFALIGGGMLWIRKRFAR